MGTSRQTCRRTRLDHPVAQTGGWGRRPYASPRCSASSSALAAITFADRVPDVRLDLRRHRGRARSSAGRVPSALRSSSRSVLRRRWTEPPARRPGTADADRPVTSVAEVADPYRGLVRRCTDATPSDPPRPRRVARRPWCWASAAGRASTGAGRSPRGPSTCPATGCRTEPLGDLLTDAETRPSAALTAHRRPRRQRGRGARRPQLRRPG